MFADESVRREFLKLPRFLQACTHFGEDIIDNSDLSKDLLSKEVRLTKDVGNCVIFDGDYGIHRGSMVKSGHRFAFQVIFSIEKSPTFFYALERRARFNVKKLLGINRVPRAHA